MKMSLPPLERKTTMPKERRSHRQRLSPSNHTGLPHRLQPGNRSVGSVKNRRHGTGRKATGQGVGPQRLQRRRQRRRSLQKLKRCLRLQKYRMRTRMKTRRKSPPQSGQHRLTTGTKTMRMPLQRPQRGTKRKLLRKTRRSPPLRRRRMESRKLLVKAAGHPLRPGRHAHQALLPRPGRARGKANPPGKVEAQLSPSPSLQGCPRQRGKRLRSKPGSVRRRPRKTWNVSWRSKESGRRSAKLRQMGLRRARQQKLQRKRRSRTLQGSRRKKVKRR
mmetsp:Transcript_44839/g.80626  ORF Transcript_44839/g.80626 Transcript_44839/m.80626 type:complete len:275 (+) Transcript_44839:848-1672(+)